MMITLSYIFIIDSWGGTVTCSNGSLALGSFRNIIVLAASFCFAKRKRFDSPTKDMVFLNFNYDA